MVTVCLQVQGLAVGSAAFQIFIFNKKFNIPENRNFSDPNLTCWTFFQDSTARKIPNFLHMIEYQMEV